MEKQITENAISLVSKWEWRKGQNPKFGSVLFLDIILLLVIEHSNFPDH